MKIMAGNKMSLIVNRSEGKEYEAIVKQISSTSLQPFLGVNFVDGTFVGGRTMSQSDVTTLIFYAKKHGLAIEEEMIFARQARYGEK